MNGYAMEKHGVNLRRFAACAATACLLLGAVCCSARADKIVLKNGSTYNGKLLSRTARTVKFRVVLANGAAIAMDFPADRVRDVTVGGDDTPPAAKPKPPKKPDAVKPARPIDSGPTDSAPARRSGSAVRALILKEGKTLPDWWDSVKLDYPRTLDLAGVNRVPGWRPRVNLGAYFFSMVTPHPKQWKPGIKLLHHVVDVRKNDPVRRPEAMGMLSNYYMRYLEDYPRAAYWGRQKDQAGGRPTLHGVVGLAECYMHMGNKQMAIALLKKYALDQRPSEPSIKLWAELGQPTTAMKLASALARTAPDSGHLAVGNLHRLAGRHDQAAASYDKVLAAQVMRGHGKLNRQRARECGFAIRLAKTLDISKVADGTHTAMSMSYRGPLHVEVKTAGGRITSARVTRHKDDIFFTSIEKTPKLIVDRQSVDKLDAVSGATVTCEAIINAATKALAGRKH